MGCSKPANRKSLRHETLNTGLLVENGARKQTLRFAVCEPWSVCDPSVSFLSANICV